MMNNLRAWLRRTPQPASLLCDDQKVPVPDTPRKWAELEETIQTLAPGKVVCLDEKGNPQRAVQLGTPDDDGPAAKSPLTSDLQALSKLLADAYRTGAETAMSAMRGSIEENTKLVSLLANRLGALEVAWQKSLVTHANLVTQLAEARSGGGDEAELASLAAMVFGGGGAPRPQVPAAPPNGKK